MEFDFETIQNLSGKLNMSSLNYMVIKSLNKTQTNKDLYDSWLLMGSAYPVISIILVYWYFVFKLGPKLMEKREPFTLKYTLIIYNAYQVLFSLAFCLHVLRTNLLVSSVTNCCKPLIGNSDTHFLVLNYGWWYFISKIIELADTVFFVLRKKQKQVTFLHVYHHSIMVLFTWGYLKYVPGVQSVMIGFLNSFVHVIMYSYYLIAALGPEYQKYLWWKKYMTKIQLTQFCLMLAYLGYIISMDCKESRSIIYFLGGNVVIFLYLFGDFYRKAYNTRKTIKTD